MAKENKMGNAFYEGNSWFHRVKLLQTDGTVKYSKKGGFQTEAEAEASYKRCAEEFKKSIRTLQASEKSHAEIGLRDYLIYWFEEVFSERVENSTRMVCAYTLYDLILPNLQQDIKLRYANVDYYDALLAIVAKCCDSAGNKAREFLNMAMKDAVMDDYIKANPIQATKPYPRKKPSVIILNKANIKKLLSVAYYSDWYLEILLGLFCGLRKGEIAGLKFSDFDAENRTLYIQRQITSNPIVTKGGSKIESYKVIEKEPKTANSYRLLKIPEVIAEEIEKRRKRKETDKQRRGECYFDSDYISCQENGMPHSMAAMNGALTKLCARNGLPHITVHGLRHMYATILVEQEVPLMKISALLGHASVNTTYEYYCDVMDENEQIITFMNNTFVPEGVAC
jgi:integrase